jgi:hypothetical protein
MSAFRLARWIATGLAVMAAAALSAAPAMAGSSDWKLGYFTPSPHGALSFASADRPTAGVATFNFTNQPNTALLVTTHGAFNGTLLGDLRGKTIHAEFDIAGASGPFTYFGEGTKDNPCIYPANTRLFFETDNGGGFAFTHFWWSNPENRVLSNGHWSLTASVEPAEWSDWNGKPGPTQVPGFVDAASNVTVVGLSFGGGCFFENGVGTTNGTGTFTLARFTLA